MEQVNVLLQMHLSDFREGYHNGRTLFFELGKTITDLDIMEGLRELAEMGHFTADDEKRQAETAYLVGQMFGQVSGHAIERQPGEIGAEDQALDVLRRQLSGRPEAEQILAAVRAFWSAQDALTRQLDAHQFHLVMHRGEQAL
ncbi:MAG: hypothetical protein J2P37_09255 [Ktedonobacteraceae bacterium]|nr:hypothetical protein [Ktedonobacteraceae bacterium]